jgi:hypothetical protein
MLIFGLRSLVFQVKAPLASKKEISLQSIPPGEVRRAFVHSPKGRRSLLGGVPLDWQSVLWRQYDSSFVFSFQRVIVCALSTALRVHNQVRHA